MTFKLSFLCLSIIKVNAKNSGVLAKVFLAPLPHDLGKGKSHVFDTKAKLLVAVKRLTFCDNYNFCCLSILTTFS